MTTHPGNAGDKPAESDNAADRNTRQLFRMFLFLVLGGFLVILLFAAKRLWDGTSHPVGDLLNGFTVLAAVAGAALVAGGFIGFLFGVPKRLQREGAEDRSQSGGTGGEEEPLYASNTNLEQISDWLTKILIGATLTQVGAISGAVTRYADLVAQAISTGGAAASSALPIAVMIYFVVAGFLTGYLWSRLYLGKALTDAERVSLRKQLRQSSLDAEALELVNRQLEPNNPEVALADLTAALGKASDEIRAYGFYKAEWLRRDSWNANRATMTRTIPIFRALIAADTAQQYYQNWAQLGYVLKDKRPPDWVEALQAFTRAIEIRGPAERAGKQVYEANRAICRIELDEACKTGRPSDATKAAEITADLKVGLMGDWVADWLVKDPTVVRWLELNPDARAALKAK